MEQENYVAKEFFKKMYNVEQFKTLYFDTVLADVRWQDKIEKYL